MRSRGVRLHTLSLGEGRMGMRRQDGQGLSAGVKVHDKPRPAPSVSYPLDSG